MCVVTDTGWIRVCDTVLPWDEGEGCTEEREEVALSCAILVLCFAVFGCQVFGGPDRHTIVRVYWHMAPSASVQLSVE